MVSEALQQSCCSQMLSVTINIIKGVSGRTGSPRFYMVSTCRIHPKNTGSPRIPPGSTPGSTLTANPKSIVKEPTDTRRGTLTDCQLGPGCTRASWIFRWICLTGQGDVQRTIIVELNGFWVVTCVVYYGMMYAVQLVVILVLDSGG